MWQSSSLCVFVHFCGLDSVQNTISVHCWSLSVHEHSPLLIRKKKESRNVVENVLHCGYKQFFLTRFVQQTHPGFLFDRNNHINFIFVTTFTVLPHFKCSTEVRHSCVRQGKHKRAAGHALNAFPNLSETNFLGSDKSINQSSKQARMKSWKYLYTNSLFLKDQREALGSWMKAKMSSYEG